jgi:hypothetical protein
MSSLPFLCRVAVPNQCSCMDCLEGRAEGKVEFIMHLFHPYRVTECSFTCACNGTPGCAPLLSIWKNSFGTVLSSSRWQPSPQMIQPICSCPGCCRIKLQQGRE